MPEMNNLYKIKQKLSVSGYHFMPFYSEEWKSYLMETSEYYIEMYRELQKIPGKWGLPDKESSFWMAAVDCMMSNLKQTLFTESARGVVKRLSVDKLDLVEDNIEALRHPPIQLVAKRLLNYWLLWRSLRNIWANSEVVYYHVAGGWPKIEENDSKWNEFVRDVEKLIRKIENASGKDPIGELRTWVDTRIRDAEDEDVYREVMLGHRKIEPDVRLIENILRMIARVLENRPEDIKKENVRLDHDAFVRAFLEWAKMFKKLAKALPHIRKPYRSVFKAAYNWRRYGKLFFEKTAEFWSEIEEIILPEVDTDAVLAPEREPAVHSVNICKIERPVGKNGKDIIAPFLGDANAYFKKVAKYNIKLEKFYAEFIRGNTSDSAEKSKDNTIREDPDYFLRGPWNTFNFLKQTTFDNMKDFVALCLAQNIVKSSNCYLGITRAGYVIAALLGWIADRPAACVAVNPVPHLGQLGYDLPPSTLLIDESFRTGYTHNLVFEYLKKKGKRNIKLFTMTSYRNWGYLDEKEVIPLSFLEMPLDLNDKEMRLRPEEMILLNRLCTADIQECDIQERFKNLGEVDVGALTEKLKKAAIIKVLSPKIEKYDVTRISLFPDLHMKLITWMAREVREELKAAENPKKGKLVIFLGSEYAVAYSGLFTLIWKYWQKEGTYGALPDIEWSPSVRGLQETAVIGEDDFRVFMDITYDTGHVCEERKTQIKERVEGIDDRDIFHLVIAPFADKKKIGEVPKSNFLVELNRE